MSHSKFVFAKGGKSCSVVCRCRGCGKHWSAIYERLPLEEGGVNVLHTHHTKTVVYTFIPVTTTLAHIQSTCVVNLKWEQFYFQN